MIDVVQVQTLRYQRCRMALHHLITDDELLHHCAKDSFFDYHAKGLHYISLGIASNGARLKLYYFDKSAATGDNLVIPHDHVYDFETMVFAGEVEEHRYIKTGTEDHNGDQYQSFSFDSPIRGGKKGFCWVENVKLINNSSTRLMRDKHGEPTQILYTR